MKKAILRLSCAVVLLGIGLTVCAGWISSVTATPTQEAAPFWLQVLILADNGLTRAELYDTDGLLLELLHFGASGSALTKLIPPGSYRLKTELGTVAFSINSDAVLSTNSPLAWTDGEQLHLTDAEVGSVRVLCAVPENDWHEIAVQSPALERQQILWQDGAAEFPGLPYGSYTLFLDGEPMEHFNLSPEAPSLFFDLRTP